MASMAAARKDLARFALSRCRSTPNSLTPTAFCRPVTFFQLQNKYPPVASTVFRRSVSVVPNQIFYRPSYISSGGSPHLNVSGFHSFIGEVPLDEFVKLLEMVGTTYSGEFQQVVDFVQQHLHAFQKIETFLVMKIDTISDFILNLLKDKIKKLPMELLDYLSTALIAVGFTRIADLVKKIMGYGSSRVNGNNTSAGNGSSGNGGSGVNENNTYVEGGNDGFRGNGTGWNGNHSGHGKEGGNGVNLNINVEIHPNVVVLVNSYNRE